MPHLPLHQISPQGKGHRRTASRNHIHIRKTRQLWRSSIAACGSALREATLTSTSGSTFTV